MFREEERSIKICEDREEKMRWRDADIIFISAYYAFWSIVLIYAILHGLWDLAIFAFVMMILFLVGLAMVHEE